MFKTIPKSNISNKNFKVYKEWYITEADIPVVGAFNESGLFDVDTSTTSQGLYVHPLYNSIKAKYYSADGNLFTQYGLMKNPADWVFERNLGDSISIIQLPQSKYGEEIKKGSIVLTIDDSDDIFVDNYWGGITSKNPTYNWISYDAETQLLVFSDGIATYEVTCSYFDAQTGIGVFTIDNITDSQVVFFWDAQLGIITLSVELLFSNEEIISNKIGNVFYDDGLIVLTNVPAFTTYTLSYRSTQTIYETEVLITAEKGEFNISQNPSAVDVNVRNSYKFEITGETNSFPAGEVTIKEIADISQKGEFLGSIGSTTGSWDDFFEYGTTDPTGSYLSTYITTIGLYDEHLNMVAVAKLPKPIKKLPNYNLNFIIRLDT